MSRHSAPSSTSVPTHPTAFRTIESDDRQTRTASSLRPSVRTLQIGFLEFTMNINAFRDKWVHGMERPKVAVGGTASNMDGSC